ncbi:gamma-tubulin complex component 5-like [Scleropages formosus]|uniref:Gamma-tubulin complex component n=1 Tax=Scleropages formosus TaxID=113540 RepID=A0A0P7V9I3_SCLFO|nr:gamma-tubulin complex component 5-like [Scleropages formosus]
MMAHSSRFERETDCEVRRLIKHISGIQDEQDHNFQLALKFAWSNFRFHRYLDVNSHKVQRSINGIYEKLMVNSDLKKAESWIRLTEEFLNSPLANTEGTKTDVHHGILALLLFLSDSPSNSQYDERPRKKEEVKEDTFDWGKYLLEGEDIDTGPFPDTPEWSEEESEEEDSQQPLSREDSGIQVDRTPQEDPEHSKKAVQVTWRVGEPESREWLEQHVVTPYWIAQAQRFSHSLHLHSNLLNVWDQHLYNTDPLYLPEEKTFVTETQVIRETLWLLSGVKKLFIFQHHDGKISVRPDVVVTHLTSNCLRSVLEHVAAYGQAVSRLQGFIDEVTGYGTEPCPPGANCPSRKGSEPPFRTYQAFVWALYKYFVSFKEELTSIEKGIIVRGAARLTPHLAQIKVLHRVFCTGVAEVPPDTPNVVRASHLLNTLYKAIIEYDSVGEASEQVVALLFSLWVETVRPYLEIVDEWIVHGHLFDPAKEFIIQRNKDVPVNHRDFWYATYTLYSVSETVENEEKLSDAASGSSASDQGSSNRQHTMVSFLKPVLKQIIMAGKSMQLLKNLDCKEAVQPDTSARDAERKSLYVLFLESVQSRLRCGEESPADTVAGQQSTRRSLIRMQSIVAQHLEMGDVHDPLLAINFARLYMEQNDFHEKFSGGDVMVDRSSESVTCQTFELTLRSCLYPHIERRYVECCGNLMRTLKKDYRQVPWPVDIVISSECQKIYNQVFLLLLQIKWAKYNLDTLRFSDLTAAAERHDGTSDDEMTAKKAVSQQVHRMFLLRVRLMHFVNSLHNYIMTRILHSTGLEFQHQVQDAKDLDQLIKIHYRYLSTIHDRCLLREKVSFVKEAIMKVLNLVLMFSDRWQAGFGALKVESIDKMESDFKNCHMFLVTILNKAVCRGSFPHLESLALSLMAGFEQG